MDCFFETLFGGFLMYIVIAAIVAIPGIVENSKFDSLGTPIGHSLSEIKRKCGEPVSISVIYGGNRLVQWMSNGFHIALVFDKNDICTEVSHKYFAGGDIK